jgi:4-hydroxybenzoate polyprenyltransferase
MRELVKDLENLKGDLTHGYKTIPVVYGEKTSKRMLTILSILTLAPIILLITKFEGEIGYMDYYFYASIAGLAVFLIVLWYSKNKIHYMVLHNILKFAIVIGVFSIVLIDVELLLNRFS